MIVKKKIREAKNGGGSGPSPARGPGRGGRTSKGMEAKGMSAVHRQLLRFKTVQDLDLLCPRLFQKVPDILAELATLKRSCTSRDEVGAIRQHVLGCIDKATSAHGLAGLPKHYENYVSFLDLVHVSRKASCGTGRFVWHTMVLQDFPRDLHRFADNDGENDDKDGDDDDGEGENDKGKDLGTAIGLAPGGRTKRPRLGILKVRKRLRRLLTESEEFAVSVQAEIVEASRGEGRDGPDGGPGGPDGGDGGSEGLRGNRPGPQQQEQQILLLLRIVIVRKSKRRSKDSIRLLTKSPTFIAYFPGEPYFYVDRPRVEPQIAEAFVRCLHSSDCCPIPLSDRNLYSLRALRLNRDGRGEGLKSQLVGRFDDEEDDDGSGPRRLPVIMSYEVDCTSSFGMRDHKNGLIAVEDFRLRAKFGGPDVLNGLAILAKEDLFAEPLPNWLRKCAIRGRNAVSVRTRRDVVEDTMPPPPPSQASAGLHRAEDAVDNDAASVAASDATCWLPRGRRAP